MSGGKTLIMVGFDAATHPADTTVVVAYRTPTGVVYELLDPPRPPVDTQTVADLVARLWPERGGS